MISLHIPLIDRSFLSQKVSTQQPCKPPTPTALPTLWSSYCVYCVIIAIYRESYHDSHLMQSR